MKDEEKSLAADPVVAYLSKEQLMKMAEQTRKAMEKAAKELEFMEAARLRDEYQAFQKLIAEKNDLPHPRPPFSFQEKSAASDLVATRRRPSYKSINLARPMPSSFNDTLRAMVNIYSNSFIFTTFDHINLKRKKSMREVDVLTREHLYVEVAERIEQLIEKQSLKVGDRLLSVRALSKEQGISLSTAFQAYYYLESKGLIEARPQSGYYVKFSPKHTLEICTPSEPLDEAIPVTVDDMISSVYHDLRSTEILSFSLGAPHVSLLPAAKLNKSVMHVLRNEKDHCLNYEHVQGNEVLRKQIARLSFNWGGR